MSRYIIATLYTGFHRRGRHLRSTLVAHQTDPDLLHPKQKGKYIDPSAPVGLVPGMIGHKNGMAADGLNGLGSSALSDLHSVASGQRQRETGEVGYISQGRRHGRSIAEMHVPDPGFAQVLL